MSALGGTGQAEASVGVEGPPIGVAVIGVGEISQVMHLPNLAAMPEIDLRAVCDISRVSLAHVATRYRPAVATTDYREVLDDPSVEAVVVATYEHGEIARAAAAAGKHVLIEKPLAFTPAEARAIANEVARTGVVGMVGYMKCFDHVFDGFLREAAGMSRIRSARVHNLAGRFDRHHGLFDVSRATDLDPVIITATAARIERQIADALGSTGSIDLLHNLLMLGSHDLAVLRTAFGRVVSVATADAEASDNVRALVRTERDVLVDLTVGIGARYDWWDEWIAVQDDERAVRADFPYPYLPNETGVLTTRTGGESRTAALPYESAFRRELTHWARCIREGEVPLTSVADAVSDVDAAYEIVRATGRMQGGPRTAGAAGDGGSR